MARPAEAFEGGQTAGLSDFKNRWLGPVARRVALATLVEGFEAFEGKQTAALNANLKKQMAGACGSI